MNEEERAQAICRPLLLYLLAERSKEIGRKLPTLGTLRCKFKSSRISFEKPAKLLHPHSSISWPLRYLSPCNSLRGEKARQQDTSQTTVVKEKDLLEPLHQRPLPTLLEVDRVDVAEDDLEVLENMTKVDSEARLQQYR